MASSDPAQREPLQREAASTGPSVLVFSGALGDTRRYRSFHLYEQLRLAGIRSQLTHIKDPQLPKKLTQARVVLFHRVAFDSYVDRLLRMIQAQGGLALLDSDDLIFDRQAFQWIDSPDFQDPLRAALYQEDMDRNRTTLERCQAVVVSTDYLAGQVRALGKPVWVHRNAFSLEMHARAEQATRSKPRPDGSIRIGYASGTRTHDRDFEVAKPALKRILARYPQTELLLIGPLDPGSDWGELGARLHHQSLVPWRELPTHLARFDINLAPLVTGNPFAQSKSEIKYVEAAMVQVPTVASPTEAFRFAIHPKENGCLASDEDGWVDALARLIEQPDLRQAMGARAYQDALARYHPAVRAAELVDTLNQITGQFLQQPLWPGAQVSSIWKDPRSAQTLWISPEIERSPSLVQIGLYTLRHRSLRTLLVRVWIYLRRLASPIWPYPRRTGR